MLEFKFKVPVQALCVSLFQMPRPKVLAKMVPPRMINSVTGTRGIKL